MIADPAIVNLPLAKRGDIDGQLDAFKREQAAEKRAADKARFAAERAVKAECFAIIDGLSDDRLAVLGAKYGLTLIQTRRELKSFAGRHPTQSLVALRKEAA